MIDNETVVLGSQLQCIWECDTEELSSAIHGIELTDWPDEPSHFGACTGLEPVHLQVRNNGVIQGRVVPRRYDQPGNTRLCDLRLYCTP